MNNPDEPRLQLLTETDEERALKALSETDPDIVEAHRTISALQIGAGVVIITGTLVSLYHEEVAKVFKSLGF